MCFSWSLSNSWPPIVNSQLLKQWEKRYGGTVFLRDGGGLRLTNHYNDRKHDVFLASRLFE